jgi:hypothetical protein
MAKRFTDTDKWKMAWFRKLGSQGRDLWNYLHDNCDASGFLELDLERMSFELGFQVTVEGIKSVLNGKFYFAAPDRIFLPAFIEFQYGELSEDCKPHLSVIKKLKKERVWEGYAKGYLTLKDKDKEQDKEKEKEEGGVGETKSNVSSAPSPNVPKPITSEGVERCKRVWLETLAKLGVKRDFALAAEERAIARAIQSEGARAVELALCGARFEPGSETWDPKARVDITRVLLPDKENNPRIQRFVDYALQAEAKAHERRRREEEQQRQREAYSISPLPELPEESHVDPARVRDLLNKTFGKVGT